MMHQPIPLKSLISVKRILVCILLLVGANLFAQSNVEEAADLLANKKFKKLHKKFDHNLSKQVSCKQLKDIWLQTEASFGSFENYSDPKVSQNGDYLVESAFLHFSSGTFKLELTENDGRISGILIRPLSYKIPSYGKELPISRVAMELHTDTFKMQGELMMPMDCKECPLVILVHGSGPHDMDETIGPNKVFYDLALGLAAQGVATYRYDKRSKVYPELFQTQFDLYDETISDALSAIEMFNSDTTYHFSHIVALGHSLGAFAMPLIADSASSLDGAILFSANARPIQDLMVYQVKYLAAIDGDTSKAERKVINAAVERANMISTVKFDPNTEAKDLMGYWPAKFWLSVSDYNQVEKASSLSMPLFIMQGEKDYQITMDDYAIWRAHLSAKNNVRFQSYPDLTHLFTPTTRDMSTPADYFIPQNVDEEVIKDIADWLFSL